MDKMNWHGSTSRGTSRKTVNGAYWLTIMA